MKRRNGRLALVGGAALIATIGVAACGGANSDRVSTADGPSGDVTTSSSTTSGYPDIPTAPDSSTTTSSSTTTTTILASPTEPTTLVLTGTHAGTEHFALGTGRCPQIDHHLDETWTATNGIVLTFSNAYCGELDAQGRWSSTGTYTLGNANGAVQGRTNNAVDKVPSPGGPYHLAIDSGTGLFAGATGSCAVEEHLVMVRFGEQTHSGPFTCTFTLPARTQEPTPPAPGS
jgi:hypothetical protein